MVFVVGVWVRVVDGHESLALGIGGGEFQEAGVMAGVWPVALGARVNRRGSSNER